jgi:hypothetical protein
MTVKKELGRLIFVNSLDLFPRKLVETSEFVVKILEGPLYETRRGVASIVVQINLYRTGESPDGWPYQPIDLPSE